MFHIRLFVENVKLNEGMKGLGENVHSIQRKLYKMSVNQGGDPFLCEPGASTFDLTSLVSPLLVTVSALTHYNFNPYRTSIDARIYSVIF